MKYVIDVWFNEFQMINMPSPWIYPWGNGFIHGRINGDFYVRKLIDEYDMLHVHNQGDIDMAHSLNKVWIHAVWATKYRAPFIDESIEKLIFSKISDEIREQGCFVKIVNGMPDHVHCLFSLNRSVPLADIIRHAKGASTFYINKHQLLRAKFAWQTGYSAFSVTHTAVEIVERYIRYQKQIHAKRRQRVVHHQWTKFGKVIYKKR